MAKRNNSQLELHFGGEGENSALPERSEVSGSKEDGRVCLRASYHFHTYCYRDPRSAFNSAVGVPVVSPTTVILGLASTLFRLGKEGEAKRLIESALNIKVIVDAPDGIVFFRAFQQSRRYVASKDFGGGNVNPRVGFTQINQSTKEFGLVEGALTLVVETPDNLRSSIELGLTNLTHLGTHDSLCSLIGRVEKTEFLEAVFYKESSAISDDEVKKMLFEGTAITMVTLSNFKAIPRSALTSSFWVMVGNKRETEFKTYVIQGKFIGTSYGRIYKKL